MSLLHCWVLNVVDSLLSMEGQKALGFHQKYLDLCFEDEQKSYGLKLHEGEKLMTELSFLGELSL